MTNLVSVMADPTTKRPCICNVLPAAAVLCITFFIASAFIATDYKRESKWGVINPKLMVQSDGCKNQCKPPGSEPLPKGIISGSSNLEMRPLWGSPTRKRNAKSSKSLLAIAVGIRQKETVNQIVKKFPLSDFSIMLFHYDGIVDDWRDLHWSDSALHVSAVNQTKWWFAKRFLHPDVVAEYSYIFLWDEDLGVENFNPLRYLSIVKEEGLEISQPALDPVKSLVHHRITVRGRNSKVHRRTYKFTGSGRCYKNSTAPPCTGPPLSLRDSTTEPHKRDWWVEMMAPVFSNAAWRCAWYMIQNDLIHAWGLDKKLGYCALGERTKKVGVVDVEYIVHQAIPTLGSFQEKSNVEVSESGQSTGKSKLGTQMMYDSRSAVRQQSYNELQIFKTRWQKAVAEDECWRDPYSSPVGTP